MSQSILVHYFVDSVIFTRFQYENIYLLCDINMIIVGFSGRHSNVTDIVRRIDQYRFGRNTSLKNKLSHQHQSERFSSPVFIFYFLTL